MQENPQPLEAMHCSQCCRAAASAVFSALLGVVVIIALVTEVLAEIHSDRFAPAQLTIGDATIDMTFAPGNLALSRTQVLDWVTTSAQAVAHYYGRFPVPHVRILITPVPGTRVGFGTVFGGREPCIKVSFGQAAGEEALRRDWVMTHEMVHLAFPRVPDAHHWIEEGIATYVEPLARLGIGQLSPETVWRDLIEGLPQGVPQPGDKGLDHTPTWGRTYWGGALFCLLADIGIRRRTANRYGLQDALRAIVVAGGTMQAAWPITRALEIGDQATGVPVLMELYNQMKATPIEIDLAELWQCLGIEIRDGTVVFHDERPLASVRHAIIVAARGQANEYKTERSIDWGAREVR